MRAFIIFLLSCVSALAANGVLQSFTSAKTNAATGSVTIKDVFTRNGQTNLVRQVKVKSGVVQIRIHRFYHAGALVADFIDMSDSAGFTTEAGSPYSASLEFDTARSPKSVVIGTKDGVVLDAFGYTNGIFSPVDSFTLAKASRVGLHLKEVMEELGKTRKEK